jgi:hypothetical protein
MPPDTLNSVLKQSGLKEDGFPIPKGQSVAEYVVMPECA